MSTLVRWLALLRSALLWLGARCRGTRVTGLLVLLLAAGVLVTGGIDAALSAMHPPGGVAADASGVSGVEAMLDAERARAALDSWAAWQVDPGAAGYLTPAALVGWYAVLDILLISVPLTLLLLRGLRRAHDDAQRQDSHGYGLRAATITVTSLAVFPAAAFLAADIAENGLLLLAATGNAAGEATGADATAWQLTLLGAAALLKWTGLVLAGLAYLLARLALGTATGTMAPAKVADRSTLSLLTPVVILRAQVLTVGVLAVLLLLLRGDLGRQVQDVLLGLPERPGHELVAVAGALVFAALTYATGRLCEDAYEHPPPAPDSGAALATRVLWTTAIAGAAVIAAGAVLLLAWGQSLGWALLPPGVLLVLFAGVSAFQGIRTAWSGRTGVPPSSATAGWLRALVALPLAAMGLVALRGAVTLAVAREFGNAGRLLGLAIILTLLAAVPFFWRSLWARVESVGGTRARVAFGAGAGVVAAVAVWGALDPWTVGERLGSLGVLFAFLAMLVVITSLLVWAGDRWAARGALAFFRLRRVPLVSLVLICFLATSYLDTSGRYHDVRLLPAEVTSYGEPMPLATAYDAWLAQQPAGEGGDKADVPMVFVATGGGGIRAAYWTTTVLDCLFTAHACTDLTLPPGSARHLFAASGISGGSTGLAAFRAAGDGDRSARVLLQDADFVAPTLAALAFRDAPNAFLRVDFGWLDRAGVLEVAWERAAATSGSSLADGFAQTSFTAAGQPRFPLLLLNGVAVEDGCRITVSILDAAPVETARTGAGRQARSCDSLDPFTTGEASTPLLARTRDAFDYTCGVDATAARDLRLSTAALLSARFPYVSPSGGLTSCASPERRTFVLDGGAIESSGAGPMVELWASLAPLVRQTNLDPGSGVCVRPRLVLIDNGYSDTRLRGLPRRPQELLAPLQARNQAAGKAAAAARQSAAITFQANLGEAVACRQPDGTTSVPASGHRSVAQLYPRIHPGPLAPLGWTLSSWAQADLRGQLRANAAQLANIRAWFG